MGSKATRKSRRQRSSASAAPPIRSFDVRQHLSRHLYAPAITALAALVKREPGVQHIDLVREVLSASAAAASRTTLHADQPEELTAAIQSILADVGDSELQTQMQKSVATLLESFSQEPILADDPSLVDWVDRAVRRPELVQRLPTEIVAELQAVVESLSAIEAGDDERAMSIVAGIGFRSPLAAWRVLIRGMVPFYAGDFAAATDVWQRLPNGRFPQAIAVCLLATVDRTLPCDATFDKRYVQSTLRPQSTANEADIIGRLRSWIDNERITDAAELLDELWRSKSVQESWLIAVRDYLYAASLIFSDQHFVRRTLAYLKPPVWDPKLELPVAISRMLSTNDGDLTEPATAIQEFLRSLHNNQQLSEMDQRAIHAVVAYHVARLLSHLLVPLSSGPIRPEKLSDVQGFGEIYVMFIEHCVQQWPQWERPLTLLESNISFDYLPQDALTRVYEQYLQAIPDHLVLLRLATRFYIESGQLERAYESAERLTRLLPRDIGASSMAWTVGRMLTQRYSLEGKEKQAKEMMQWATSHQSHPQAPVFAALLRAVVYYKFGDNKAAQKELAAIDQLPIPRAAALMILEIHMIKFKVSAAIKKPIVAERKQLMKTLSLTDTCHLVRLCGPAVANAKAPYTGNVSHRKELIQVCKQVITKMNPREWTVSLANEMGEFAILAGDKVLQKKFYASLQNGRHFWPIGQLAGALNSSMSTAYSLLREVMEVEWDESEQLPPHLLESAKALFNAASEELEYESDDYGYGYEYDDDDEEEDDEEEELSAAETSRRASKVAKLFFDSINGDPIEELIRSMPAELFETFTTNPKEFERQIRKMFPDRLAQLIVDAMKIKSQRSR